MSDAPPSIDHDDTVFAASDIERFLAVRPSPAVDAMGRALSVHPAASTAPLTGLAAQIALILTAAERWTVFSVDVTDARGTGLLVESPDGTLMAHPRELGAWSFILIDPDAAIDRLVSQTAMAYARDSSVTVRTSTLDIARTFAIVRSGDELRFASGPADDPTAELCREHAAPDEIAEYLSEFIGAWPSPLEH